MLKGELVHEENYANRQEGKQSIFKYIELYYNWLRLHLFLGYEAFTVHPSCCAR